MSLPTTTNLFAPQTGLTGGASYSYQVRAYNKYGAGPFTAPITMQTSQAPDQPAPPVLAVVGGYVKISWTAPFANYRPVTAYQILIKTSATTATYIEQKALCDGAAQASVGYCLVDMHALTASPFNLVYGTLVQAEVLAENDRGWSIASAPNTDVTGATIEVAPSAVSTPTRGALTGPTQV